MTKEGTRVYVKKGGFLSALALGLFGTVSVMTICGTAVIIVGMTMAHLHLRDFVAYTPKVAEAISHWQDALPPALADAVHDRRAPEYREHVEVSVRMVQHEDEPIPVVEVTNRGDRMISLMSLRIVLEDEQGTPLREIVTYAATPLAIESDWRGPLLPGSQRRFSLGRLWWTRSKMTASVEVTDLRVWEGTAAGPTTVSQRELLPSIRAQQAAQTAGEPGKEAIAPGRCDSLVVHQGKDSSLIVEPNQQPLADSANPSVSEEALLTHQ